MRKPRTKLRDLREGELVETRNVTCKVCKIEKTAILAGRWGQRGKEKKWVDEEGRTWNGKSCPICHSRSVYQARVIKKESKNNGQQ